MSRRIVPLTVSNVEDIPYPCRTCAHWLDTDHDVNKLTDDQVEEFQTERVRRILRDWGSCGFIAYADEEPVAYTLYGPPEYFPRTQEYRAGPVSPDAIFLACIYVDSDLRGHGVGQHLLVMVEKQMHRAKFKAIEIFANRRPEGVPVNPVDFFLGRGFYVKKDDRQFPLLRLDLRSLAVWQRNVEAALESISRPLTPAVPKKAPVPL